MDDGGLYYNGGLINTGAGCSCVSGPALSTDTALAIWDGTTGDLLKNSTATLSTGGLLTTTALTIGTSDAIKNGAYHLLSNANNLLIGLAGSSYTAEQDNILIENTGEVGDIGVIRVGTTGTHESCYLAGLTMYLNDVLCIHRTGDATDWNAFFFAGNTSITGGENCGFGKNCMGVHTSGWDNTAMGAYCMASSLTCNSCTAIGAYALNQSTNCTSTIAIGTSTMDGRSTGTHNIGIGQQAGSASVLAAAGTGNTIVGSLAGVNYSGDANVYAGYMQGRSITGSRNIRIHGSMHGFASTGSDNIFIGSYGNTGALTETATIRLGTQGTQTACLVAGIYDSSLSIQVSNPVRVDSFGKLFSTPINERGLMGQIAYENAATTGIPMTINVPSEINPGTTITNIYGFASPANGRIKYTLTSTRTCKVSFWLSLKLNSGANQTVLIQMAKNGVAIPSAGLKILIANATDYQTITFNSIVSLATDDYISVFATNQTASNNIAIYSMCICCTGFA